MTTATTTTRVFASVHTRECDSKSAPRRRTARTSCDPGKVAIAYAIDSRWRNRSEFMKPELFAEELFAAFKSVRQ